MIDTEKKVQLMTLDDLQTEITRRARQDGAGKFFSEAVQNEMEGLVFWITERRRELEAGIREIPENVWVLLDDLDGLCEDADPDCPEVTEQRAIIKALRILLK